MGLKEEGGALAGLGRAMGLGFGRKSARKGCYCSIMHLSWWGMRVLKMRGLRTIGTQWGKREGGLHFSLDLFNDWEVEEVERLLSSIQDKRLDADGEDRMLWKGTKNEIFTVKSLYKSLDHSCAVSFPGNIIWSPYVPSKVSFFAWEASWEKVLTQDQLKRRGWILANRCCLCFAEKETINHILVHCSKTKILWDLVFSLFGVNWVLPFPVKDTFLSWYVSFKDKNHRKDGMKVEVERVVVFSCNGLMEVLILPWTGERGVVCVSWNDNGVGEELRGRKMFEMSVHPNVELVAQLGCRMGELPVVCLGLPLGSPYKSSVGWYFVEERIYKRMYMDGGSLTMIDFINWLLREGPTHHFAIGLKILNQLVSEMNQSNPGVPLSHHRRIACSFRDQSLLQIFRISLTSLYQLKDDDGSKLQELALSLSLRCLSFDFMGTSFDESSDEFGTVQK
ncbi:Exportin-7 [Vitis vinifera]|uniref:Exportin-7 n=1 Tax=Vitis vinifera TaxID=29760 RepID=A0A438BXX5_VITVI|nr:Exportin-7 [Vitis vinifera]